MFAQVAVGDVCVRTAWELLISVMLPFTGRDDPCTDDGRRSAARQPRERLRRNGTHRGFSASVSGDDVRHQVRGLEHIALDATTR